MTSLHVTYRPKTLDDLIGQGETVKSLKRVIKDKALWKAFLKHRRGAKRRKIEFFFTFEEWLIVWLRSGKINERGPKGHHYCMTRKGDKGPYAIWNVVVKTRIENSREGSLGKKLPPLTRQKMSASKKGIPLGPFTEEHKRNLRLARKGMKLSEIHKQRIGLACKGKLHYFYGKKHTLETREKISQAVIAHNKKRGTP